MKLVQEHRRIAINTPLGPNVLVITHLDGGEEFSRPFTYKIRMLSERDDIAAEEIVGQNVSITMMDVDDVPHYLNGYVRTFVNHGHGDRASIYSAEVVAWIWFLTQRTDCRIFQELSVPQIVEAVFRSASLTDFELSGLKSTYPKREYCVQYRETDFAFVSRLLEEEGIFYYFRHEDGKHVLVLGDSPDAYMECKHSKVRYYGPLSFTEFDDNITGWEHRYEFRTGRIALADFNFQTPDAPVRSKERTVLKVPTAGHCEFYDYPGNFLDRGGGDARARRFMEAEETGYDRVIGSSKCRSFGPGRKFTVAAHHVSAEEGKTHVITKVHHRVDAGSYVPGGDKPEGYSNDFETIPAATPFRPPRETPRGVVRGPQTAIVVGPAGEEIYTDKHGRVKVKFHWDRTPNVDENSSCWLRVAQSWASRQWGSMFLPRIGDEVIVDFLEGDPDRPIITGRVYNAHTTTPYTLPDNKHLSGIKTNSTKGGGGFNEIRFDDTKGQEHVFIHAEKDHHLRVKNDAYEWHGNDQHAIIKRDRLEQIEGDAHCTVKGDANEKVQGTVSQQIQQDLQQKVGMKHAVDAGMEIHLKAGMNVVLEAGMSITLKAGGGFIVVGPAGVTISGTPVLINSGGAAGSGSGCSPDAAKLPKEALKAEPGKVAEVKPREPEEPVTFSGSTKALQMAANAGTPFCERCAEAAAAAQASGNQEAAHDE
jgi:type VI secretion system secreted protein VgrG